MSADNDSRTLTILRKTLGILGVYRTSSYVAYRNRKDGSVQEVAVRILDGGADVPAGIRFQCFAESSDGKAISGSPASTVDGALSMLDWEELD